MPSCCFTGHRTIAKKAMLPLARALDKTLADLFAAGVTDFYTGGAIGFDTLAALRVLALREKEPSCRLTLVLPCRDQSKLWDEGARALYEDILARADEVFYVREHYTPDCMRARNEALIQGKDILVAYLTRSRGGTASTYLAALRAGLDVINLAEQCL